MVYKKLVLLFLLFGFSYLEAQTQDNVLKATFIDVGAGLSVVVQVPGEDKTHYILYDFGDGRSAVPYIKTLIPQGTRADLIVLSHTDADHVKGLKYLLKEEYLSTDNVLRTGFPKKSADRYLRAQRLPEDQAHTARSKKKNTRIWTEVDQLIDELDCQDYNLADLSHTLQFFNLNQAVCQDPKRSQELINFVEILQQEDFSMDDYAQCLPLLKELGIDCSLDSTNGFLGKVYSFGLAEIQVLAGFSKPPYSEERVALSEAVNGVSIVLKIMYAGKSILLTGDAVGREQGSPEYDVDHPPIMTERYMLEHFFEDLDSDVLQVAHHGSDDASTPPFLRAVSPSYAVIAAGHKHRHPVATMVQRLFQVLPYPQQDYIFRTDRGDHEPAAANAKAHQIESIFGNDHEPQGKDLKGDDHIQVVIDSQGNLMVNYIDIEKTS